MGCTYKVESEFSVECVLPFRSQKYAVHMPFMSIYLFGRVGVLFQVSPSVLSRHTYSEKNRVNKMSLSIRKSKSASDRKSVV